MYKYLLEIIKNLEGNIIGVGLDDMLLSGFNKNNKVCVYTINRAPKTKIGFGKSKKRTTSSGRTINIKKLYKYFKKESIDYIIGDVVEVNDYLKYFIRDSIYLDRKRILLFGSKDKLDVELFEKRYKRYKCKFEIKQFKDSVLLIIDNSNSKTNWFKNKLYFISDTLYNVVEFISNVLVS